MEPGSLRPASAIQSSRDTERATLASGNGLRTDAVEWRLLLRAVLRPYVSLSVERRRRVSDATTVLAWPPGRVYAFHMASDPAARAPATYAEYVGLERTSGSKHEFVRGELFAMAGGRRAHNLVAGNVTRLLGNALLGRPCLVFNSDMRVRTGDGVGTYPDASALCGKPTFSDSTEDELLNPSVIVEVLSESTERYDRGDKFEHYRSIASFDTYVLVSSSRSHVEVFSRGADGAWSFREFGSGQVISLGSIGVELTVDELYSKVFGELP